jgi:hypothetical protein
MNPTHLSSPSWSPLASMAAAGTPRLAHPNRRGGTWPASSNTEVLDETIDLPSEAAPDADAYFMTPAHVLLELSLRTGSHGDSESLAPWARLPDPYSVNLQYRDRSLYAWFESVGWMLTLAALTAACAALVLG